MLRTTQAPVQRNIHREPTRASGLLVDPLVQLLADPLVDTLRPGGAPVQRRVSMKSLGGSKGRTTGTLQELWAEVWATIDGGDLNDLQYTESQLTKSINSREEDLGENQKNTDSYDRHMYRLNKERDMRARIRQAIRDCQPPPTTNKKPPPGSGGSGGRVGLSY